MELMFTITVLGILVGLAVPSFKETVRNNRLIAQNNELVSGLNLARSEALKRSGSVSICASTDAATCSGDADWTTGWIVFSDLNNNGAFDGDPEELLRSQGAAPPEFTIKAGGSFVRFAGTGMAPTGIENFELVRTSCTGLHARRISVSVVGRISTRTVACP
jgi:type IV fimbrial biogenesis protein FimT